MKTQSILNLSRRVTQRYAIGYWNLSIAVDVVPGKHLFKISVENHEEVFPRYKMHKNVRNRFIFSSTQ